MSSSKSIGLQQAGGEGAGCRTFPMGTSHFMAVMNPSIPSRIKGEEITLCWDEQPTKVRKPYTITKQRERWTEEEHQKFLESLKLYGRTWRRIEEHIGTKSAVQIRSHAQKFFSKLGREPSTSGLLTWGAQDIEIPPPRPKRKPSHPYPRKACSTVSSSPSIEEDTISPSAVCSSSNSFESLKYRLQTSPLKNAMCTLSSNQGSLLTLDTSNISRASIGSSPKVGSPTSLKLFGQTLTISVAQSADVSAADQVHLDSVKTVGEPSIKSSSVDSESRGSLASEREEVEFSMPCFTNDIEASCGDSRVNVEKSTLHSTEVPSKENDQVQKWKPEAGAGYHRATLKENIIHQVFPGDNEGQQVEDQSCLDEQNISIITDPEIHTFAPGVNSSVPLHRFPSLPSGVSSNHQEGGQMGLVSHSPFQHPVYGTFESLAWFECWAAKNCIGNSFTSLELAAQQNLAASATAFWPGFVHSASDQYETEEDASTGAAVAAASFAAASAYWSLLREVQSGIYPKIAVVTAPARLTSNGPTCMFESVAKVKEQELNHRTAFDRKTENPDHKHECGVNIMTHDKETVGSKVNSIETHISKAKFPTERCHSGPEFLGGCLISDTSSWDADSKLPKKRLGSSYSVEYGARKKGSKGVSNEALIQFHTSVGVSESRDENINCTSGTDIGCVQTNRNGNVAKKWQVKSPLASQDMQRNIGHSASNDIGSFDETLCEVASSEREEKVKNVSEQKDISDAWQNQQGNSRQVGMMATKQCQLLDAGDQEFHKLFRAEAVENVTAFQSQVTSVPLSMVEAKEMASLSSPDNVTNLLHDEVVMLIPLAKSVAKDGQLCSTSEVDNNLKETFRRGLKPAVVSETKVRFSLEKDYEGEFRNPKTETGSVKTSCAIKHPKMFLGTEDCGNTELLPSERCDVVKAERDEDLLSGLKIRGGIGSSRYSGVGFVPYKKSL